MIGVYMQSGMSEAQYREVDEKLMASGVEPKGLKVHTCFGEDGHLSIFDVWESKEDFEALAGTLGPIFTSLGIEPIQPEFVQMIDFRTA